MSDKDKTIEPQKSSQAESPSEIQDTQGQDNTDNASSATDAAFDDSIETNNTADSSSEPDDRQNPPSSTPPKTSKKSSGTRPIKWFILLIILAAIVSAVFFGWQEWQQYQANLEKTDRIDHVEQQLLQQQKSFASSLSKQTNDIRQLTDQLEQNRRYVGQLQEQLRSTQRKIQAQNSEKQNEWLFNEAEYLIREASYKLNFTDDAASIIALLQAADSQLAELNDGSLTALRQAISQDINKVRGSGNLDIEGIAIRIETLKSNVDQLELASVQLNTPKAIEPTVQDEADISSWQHFKNSLSKAASKYYTVHRFDESTQPFISPQKDRLLRENIILNLQTAQLAALQHNQTLYQANLNDVKEWVKQYFKQQPATTQAYLQQINELLASSVELDLPSNLESYQLVSDISQQKVNQWLNSDTPAENTTQPKTEESESIQELDNTQNNNQEEEPSA